VLKNIFLKSENTNGKICGACSAVAATESGSEKLLDEQKNL
jgi:hypothetical protein